MKKSKVILGLALCTMFFYLTSCSKKHDPTPTKSGVSGYWFGSANGGAFNQSFLLNSNGTLIVYDFYANGTSTDTTQAYKGTGTYTVSNNTITVNTVFSNGQTFSAKATLNLTASPATMTFGANEDGYNGDVYRKQ